MSVNALAAYKAKEELKTFSYSKREPGDFEIFIKISHCGICHSDIHLIDNDWMISRYPLVPGHEIVGTVIEKGKMVEHLKVGQRVGVGWQSGSCHTCDHCSRGEENMCSKSVATAVGHYGGFADYVYTDSRFAFPIPEKLDSENAAPLMCGGITVYSPMRLYGLKPFHKVGVVGIGGLGHLAVQYAKAFGCEVTAFSSTPDKEAEAHKFGADYFVNSKDEKALKNIYGSLDFIITTVTAPLNWSAFINILRPNGRLNFVGATVGNIEINPGMLVTGQKSVSGSAIGGIPMIREMLEFSARHNIVAQTEAMKMQDANEAIEKVRKNQARYRMVLVNE